MEASTSCGPGGPAAGSDGARSAEGQTCSGRRRGSRRGSTHCAGRRRSCRHSRGPRRSCMTGSLARRRSDRRRMLPRPASTHPSLVLGQEWARRMGLGLALEPSDPRATGIAGSIARRSLRAKRKTRKFRDSNPFVPVCEAPSVSRPAGSCSRPPSATVGPGVGPRAGARAGPRPRRGQEVWPARK